MRKAILILVVLLFAGQIFAEVIHVPGDYPTIQEAIDVAGPGDIVMVAPGVYVEEITLKADVIVIGAGEGLSIIDGGGDQGDVVFASGNVITNTTKLQGFTITGANYAGMPGGGGIFCNTGASPEICNNRIEGNSTGIATWNGATPFLHNNVVIDNTYTGVSISSKPTVINNTIANNNNGIYDSGGYQPVVMNNIVTGNSNKGMGCVNSSVPTDFSYNDVWGNGQNYYNCSPGPGDISANPLFVDEPNGDYHLQPGSPCIDSGNPDPAYNDPDGSRNDMGAYGGPGAASNLPQVTLTIPSQNELNILYNTDVSAVFNMDMNPSTFTSLTFKLNGHLAGIYSGIVNYDSAAKIVSINPDNNLRCGELVTATLTKGIQSLLGDSLEGYIWQFTAMVEGGSGFYLLPTYYAVDLAPNSAVTGDFNSNGNLDIAVVNVNSNNVSILLGNGDGTFSSAINYSTGTSPYSICTGDFNSDGNLDLAVANGGSNNVSILLGNGDGSFGSAVNYSAGTLPNAICSGDFDFDGELDLATANANSNDVSILLGNGDGSFGSPSNFSVGISPYSVCTGDFDNNGILDLVTANGGSNNISILLGNGDGNFDTATNFSCGTTPYSVSIGDFDGDGDLDLGVANGGSNNVSILIGNGNGTFGSAINYPVGNTPYSISTSDVDGDGRLDLTVANGSSDDITVLFGNGDGSFGAANNYYAGDNPHSVVGGDFDNDGDIDLCTANYDQDKLSILLNEDALFVVSTNPFQYQLDVLKSTDVIATFNIDLNASTVDSSTFILFGAQTGPHPGIINYDSVTITATLDPSTDFIDGEEVTVILTKAIQASSGVYLKGFSWNFTSEITTPSDGTFGNRQDYSASVEPRGLFAGDLDADGDIDIAITLNQGAVAIRLNNGDGTFSSASTYSISQEPIAMYGADLDWDGDIDLATINNRPGNANLDILKNNGNGTFTVGASYTLSVMGNSIAGADFDSDGDIDIVLSSYWGSSDNVYIMLNNGNATFSGPYIYTAGTWAHGVIAKDVDNDGALDIGVVNSGNDNISILLNDGDGNFPDLANYPVGSSPYSVYGNDFNGDGYLDIVTANYGGDNITVILNNGDGTFASPAGYSTGSNTRHLTGGDVDGDGDIDLLGSINGADSVSVIFNNGDGTFANLSKYQVGSSPWGIQTADFDLDGDLDIACANYNTDNFSILFNSGVGVEETVNPNVEIKKWRLTVSPNPFSTSTTITFTIPRAQEHKSTGAQAEAVELEIYDVSGRLVKDFSLPTAYSLLPSAVSWDGRDDKGNILPSGVYFCKLKTDNKTLTRKILCVR
ncbi:MAG: T9SS type A sorting domain-containing protein [Candidatus Cloacimonadota bacterium]|nr:MAG: T9SS type A sorting domain-containing protein [Candidatus Cloacimonadota bacterium]